MGLLHNQYPIVTTNLLTHFDPANGSSMISNKKNLMYLDETNTSNYYLSSGTISYDSTNESILWDNDLYESWGSYIRNSSVFNYSLNTTKQYTASFECKIEGGSLNNMSFEIADDPDIYNVVIANVGANVTLLSTGWYKFTYTFTPSVSGRNAFFRVIHGYPRGTRVKFWWRKLQVEEGSVNTSYVSGVISNTLYDISGNNLHGTIFNPAYDSLNGGSLYMNGSTTYIDTGNKYLRNYNSGTIDLWAKTRDITAIQHFFYEGSGGDGFGGEVEFHISVNASTAGVYIPYGGLSPTGVINFINNYSSGAVSNNTWFNVVFAYSYSADNSSITFATYHNNVSTGSGTLSNPPRTSLSGGNALLGRPEGYGPNPARSSQGSIGTFKFYNRFLSATEISQNFNALKGRYGL